jgi:hypothetical protein
MNWEATLPAAVIAFLDESFYSIVLATKQMSLLIR